MRPAEEQSRAEGLSWVEDATAKLKVNIAVIEQAGAEISARGITLLSVRSRRDSDCKNLAEVRDESQMLRIALLLLAFACTLLPSMEFSTLSFTPNLSFFDLRDPSSSFRSKLSDFCTSSYPRPYLTPDEHEASLPRGSPCGRSSEPLRSHPVTTIS
jgi:hypothetical protein